MTKAGLMALLGMLMSCQTLAQSEVFSAERFNQIKQQYQGKRFMVLMWSIDCPPCFKELAHVGELKKQIPTLPVILINTDGDDQYTNERQALLTKYTLNGLTNLHFADGKAAQGRFAVDSGWHGELPRNYFYQRDGQRTGRSGLLSEDILRRWLQPVL